MLLAEGGGMEINMGIFITVEGPNGVGKSTFIKRLEQTLSLQHIVFLTKEPSDSNFGKYVKENEEVLSGEAYAYLIAADRCYHIKEYIEPALDKGKIVISDRYIESSFVLQEYDGVKIEDIWRLNCKFRVPDLSIILLGAEETLENRLSERSKLTHFETKMTRRDEIEGYIRAANYLKNKGFNIIMLYNNTELEMKNNLNKVKEIIFNIYRSRRNG